MELNKANDPVTIEFHGEPLRTSKNNGYEVRVGSLNGGAPTYMIRNRDTGVVEYISQTLGEAIRAADGIEADYADALDGLRPEADTKPKLTAIN